MKIKAVNLGLRALFTSPCWIPAAHESVGIVAPDSLIRRTKENPSFWRLDAGIVGVEIRAKLENLFSSLEA